MAYTEVKLKPQLKNPGTRCRAAREPAREALAERTPGRPRTRARQCPRLPDHRPHRPVEAMQARARQLPSEGLLHHGREGLGWARDYFRDDGGRWRRVPSNAFPAAFSPERPPRHDPGLEGVVELV